MQDVAKLPSVAIVNIMIFEGMVPPHIVCKEHLMPGVCNYFGYEASCCQCCDHFRGEQDIWEMLLDSAYPTLQKIADELLPLPTCVTAAKLDKLCQSITNPASLEEWTDGNVSMDILKWTANVVRKCNQ